MSPARSRIATRTPYLALLVVFMLAAAQRILNIDGPALWTDEGFTYYTFTIDLFDAIIGDRHPPFYFVTLHGWAALAGDSILSLRWWSFLPSLLTVAFAYQLGRELVRLRPGIAGMAGAFGVPVLAALFMALIDAENYMAQELRMYTWHVCFAAWSTLALLRYARHRTWRELALYVVAAALLMYTHYFGAFVLAAHGLYALLFLRGRVRVQMIAALFTVGLFFVPWFFGVTLQQFADEEVCINCAAASNLDVLRDFGDKWLGDQWPLLLALMGVGIVTGWRGSRRDVTKSSFLLLALLLIPVAGTYALGHEELVLLARRMVQITVPLVLLFALGAGSLVLPARIIIAVAITLYGVTTVDWYRQKVPWDEISAQVALYAQPGDLVLAEVAYEEAALRYYLDHDLPDGVQISTYPVWSDMPRYEYDDTTLPALLDDHNGGVWLVDFVPQTIVTERIAAAGFVRTWAWQVDHLGSTIEIFRYDRLPEVALATFENDVALRDVTFAPQNLYINLIWDVPSEANLQGVVTSAVLLDANGVLVAQQDNPPFDGTTESPIYDPKQLQTVSGGPLPPGEYTLAVQVYRFVDGAIVPIPPRDGESPLVIERIIIGG